MNSGDVSPEELGRVRGLIDQALKQEAAKAVDGAPPSAKHADKPLPRPAPPPPVTIEEVSAAQEAVSTFSLHVSDVSFKLALAALASGTWPDRATIRPEEFYNAFDYGDPATAASEKISCRIEQAAHPFAQQRNLVRIALRVPATGRGAGQPLHLTVLLDTSGSMERPDRRATVRSALATLVGLLGPADRLTLVGFARQPRLLAEALDGNHANQALALLDRTPAEGGTNLEEALKLGGELARRQFLATAQNRIVLLTDGAANLGDADPDRLSAAVEALRAQRIAFDACGVGLDGLDDTILEALTRKGDGRYYVLNSPDSADAGFARQLAGALRPAAENVKVQVRFNPARVGHYRLVGFEKHRLREEDFRNDAVDAAELAAEEAAVAVYEIEAKPQGEGEVGEVFVRFRDAATKEMVERSWTLPYEARAAAFDRASPSLQLAGTAAMLAEKIRGGPAGDRVELDALTPIVNALCGRHPDDKRLQELATMFAQMRRLQGK
jgi:secreted protein with Ig-like and vWFA domain